MAQAVLGPSGFSPSCRTHLERIFAAARGIRRRERFGSRPADFKPPAYRKRDAWPKTSMHLIGAQVATHQDQKRADIPWRPASPRSPQRRPGSETRGSRIHPPQQVDP